MNRDLILSEIIETYEKKALALQSEIRNELIQNNIICRPFVEITIHDMDIKLVEPLKTIPLKNDNGNWFMFVSPENTITIHSKSYKLLGNE